MGRRLEVEEFRAAAVEPAIRVRLRRLAYQVRSTRCGE